MGKILISVFSIISFSYCSAQAFKSNSELRKLSDAYKIIYFDELSDTVDQLNDVKTFVDSGYIHIQNLPSNSPVYRMIEYLRIQIHVSDSASLSNGQDSSELYSINFSDSIFYKNTYYSRNGRVLKLLNFIAVPHFNNEAAIYYLNGEPYKSLWFFSIESSMQVRFFYFFNKEDITDNVWEDFKAYSPFEYLRTIDLIKDFKSKFY